MKLMFAEVTNTHAALNEARRVIDALAGQLQQHQGWLQAAHADAEAAKAQVRDLEAQLGTALCELTQAREAAERLSASLHGEQARRAQTEQALAAERALMDPFRTMGPMTLRVAHLLQGSSHRFPQLARGLKSVLRSTARLKRLVRPPRAA
jgi:chromosome segregation ATPase